MIRPRHLLPSSLFGRALLILLLPTLLVQLVATYMFYNRHWDNVRRHMALALANEVAYLASRAEQPGARAASLAKAEFHFGLQARWLEPETAGDGAMADRRADFPVLAEYLEMRLAHPFVMRHDRQADREINIRIRMAEGTLEVAASKKRIASATTYIFILWMSGAALIFSLIAVLFLRNQIRPMQSLAEVAEAFGRGLPAGDFRPRGADEVRRAGRAFLLMRERISRQITKRTEMLAAISHDLRTPLTRMKLQLAMLPDEELKHELTGDVLEMERTIQEYLDFVRGEGSEQPQRVDLFALLAGLVEDYARSGRAITLQLPESTEQELLLWLRPHALRRALQNILNNALRYGEQVALGATQTEEGWQVWVEDDGPGIPAQERERVLKPFYKLDAARKPGEGGVGLGLAIAKDIVLGHGGSLTLEAAPQGGLRVVITLPG